MSISINAEMAFDKILHGFMVKILRNEGLEEAHRNNKAVCDKPFSDILK